MLGDLLAGLEARQPQAVANMTVIPLVSPAGEVAVGTLRDIYLEQDPAYNRLVLGTGVGPPDDPAARLHAHHPRAGPGPGRGDQEHHPRPREPRGPRLLRAELAVRPHGQGEPRAAGGPDAPARRPPARLPPPRVAGLPRVCGTASPSTTAATA